MTSALDQMGGETALQRLVTQFYDLMETLPQAHDIHRLHFCGHGIEHTRVEQFNFLCGFLGGRQYYMETHGHMNVREIHAHIPIRQADAEVWLATMDKALAACDLSGPHVDKMRATLARVAAILINDLDDWRKEGAT
jgi:hemoglobin